MKRTLLLLGLASSLVGFSFGQTASMPPQTGTFDGATRGYYFTAPVDFTITGVKALNQTGGSNAFQNFEIVRFNGGTPPPGFPTVTNAFTQLANGLDLNAAAFEPVTVEVSAGDVIGIYGNTTDVAGDTDGQNSYAAAPATTTIAGNTVDLFRSGMQSHLGSATTTAMADIWGSPVGPINRIEFTYSCTTPRCAETTYFNNNGGSPGGVVYFDLEVSGNRTITGLDTNFNQPAGTPVGMTVYTTPGTYVGVENNSVAWTIAANDNGLALAAGEGAATRIDFDIPLDLAPGNYGIALVAENAGHSYTNGTGSNQLAFSCNGALTMTLGAAQNVPFVGAPFTPRVWNGRLCEGYSAPETAAMPPQSGTFDGNTRGYFFTAPTSFTMTGVKVLNQNGVFNPIQNYAVMRFDGNTPPPALPMTTNAFTQLAVGLDLDSSGFVPVNIPITAGDVIGVFGNTMPAAGGGIGFNSYGNSAPNTTTIGGQVVELERLGMQFNLGSGGVPGAQDLWTAGGGNITRIEFTYQVGNGEFETFCAPAVPNSTGQPTLLTGSKGSGVGSDLHLEATQGPPAQFGYFLMGTLGSDPGIPVGNGRLCVAGSSGPLQPDGYHTELPGPLQWRRSPAEPGGYGDLNRWLGLRRSPCHALGGQPDGGSRKHLDFPALAPRSGRQFELFEWPARDLLK